ncbi:myrosinase 1-like [Aricia agestis]|uniref:myrosinase 1-like n=1 Tax=Aricia agestis TaxID=91739 RepID=UPI001C202827|nr:myrosinase 1-like [Aricia agestis]
MLTLKFLVLTLGFVLNCHAQKEPRKFPEHLLFGTATASYQIEGAWNEDGKSENIWDRIAHQVPCPIKNCDTGDDANQSYRLYKRDVEMARELGLDFYRFSLSWSRILPTSFPDVINQAGVDYYNNLIDELRKYNIEPMVTIYHWDLPQKLQDLGGWSNPHIVDWFSDYSRIVFKLFGDRVKYWITMNEPREVCVQGYSDGSLAPLLNITGYAEYLCTKNLLVAHAKTYHIYNDEFRSTQGGTIGITLSAKWYEPENDDHMEASEDHYQFEVGQYAYPIFSKTGDFPPSMKKRIAENSEKQGFFRSRLPEFTADEIELVRGSSDFLGINHYTTLIAYRNESVDGVYDSPSYRHDMGVIGYALSDWPKGASSWLNVVPWGFYKLLTKIKDDFDNPPVIIAENGFSSQGGLNDDDRIDYYRSYLDAMLDAMEEGCDVRAYTAWSLMDNFEWLEGYSERFGLYEVDFKSPEKTRTPRKSAYIYKEMLRTRTLDFSYEPDMTKPMTIDDGL